MPRPLKIKFRSGEPISSEMDNSFVQDPKITDEKLFENTVSGMVISQIIISGPLQGYTSPLVINLTNTQDDVTVSVEYAPSPGQTEGEA